MRLRAFALLAVLALASVSGAQELLLTHFTAREGPVRLPSASVLVRETQSEAAASISERIREFRLDEIERMLEGNEMGDAS